MTLCHTTQSMNEGLIWENKKHKYNLHKSPSNIKSQESFLYEGSPHHASVPNMTRPLTDITIVPLPNYACLFY